MSSYIFAEHIIATLLAIVDDEEPDFQHSKASGYSSNCHAGELAFSIVRIMSTDSNACWADSVTWDSRFILPVNASTATCCPFHLEHRSTYVYPNMPGVTFTAA